MSTATYSYSKVKMNLSMCLEKVTTLATHQQVKVAWISSVA